MSAELNELQDRANRAIASGQVEQARELFGRMCELEPANANAWKGLGLLSLRLGDMAGAECAFNALVELDPAGHIGKLGLGQVYESQGNDAEAETAYRAAAQLDGAGEAAMALGMLLGRQHRHAEAVELFESVIRQRPAHVVAHYCLASSMDALGDTEGALSHYRRTVEIQPDYARAHNSMGVLLQKHGSHDAAAESYHAAISSDPNYVLAHYNLGTNYKDACRYTDAARQFRRVLELQPEFHEARLALGLACDGLGKKQAAIDCYRKILGMQPDHVAAMTNLALVLQARGDSGAALPLYNRVLELAPDTIQAICGLAGCREIEGDYEGALELLEPLFEKGNTGVALALAFGSISGKVGRRDDAIVMLQGVLAAKNVPADKQAKVHYLLGKLYDEKRLYEHAFEHMAAANAIERQPYDVGRQVAWTENLRAVYSAENMHQYARATGASELPVFIVGMPRSGTTLVEQILASHPGVYGAGELVFLADIFRQVMGADRLAGDDTSAHLHELSPAVLDGYTQQYLDAVQALAAADMQRITDKMPHNFQYIGLIEQLFPRARVIHCVRNPLDVCLSIFATPFNASHPYANDLDVLGRYYRQCYEPLMVHWKVVCSLPILDIHYESLVSDQESVTRQLIDFCGLDWDDRCLEFYAARRSVATPSKNQVRQPIYRHAKDRWRNYAEHLAPLRAALGLVDETGNA